MDSFKRSIALFVSALALLSAALVPALASADAYYPYTTGSYNNCGVYNSNYQYNNSNYNQNCGQQGSVTIYTQVNNQYGGSQSASDFTLYVSGSAQGQQYVAGSQNGTTVWVNGSYSVSVYNQTGYTPTYSSGCSGMVSWGQTAICYVTLTNSYNYNNNYPQYPYYQPYVQPTTVQVQPVTVVAKYVPTLYPNTGFEPISAAAVGFALALLAVVGALLLPYVRKAFAVVLR